MKTVKICFVIGTLEVGGAEKQLFLLIKNLDRKKFFPVLIALRDGRMREDFEKVAGIHVAGKRWKLDILFLIKLARILRREKPDILHTFMFTSNLWGRLAGLLCRVPVMVASERSMDLWKSSLHLLPDRILARFTRKIVCNSREVERRYQSLLGKNYRRLCVIYNGIDADLYAGIDNRQGLMESFGICPGNPVIITGGRLCSEKGLKYFLRAAAIVAGIYREARFLVVGDGDEKKNLLDEMKNLGLEKKVVFTGYRRDLPELLKLSDIVVLSSLWEGMPNLLIEGMALRKPVIGTAVGGTVEIVKDGETGYLVPSKNHEMLAGAMLCLLNDEGLRRKMGERGYEFVKNNLSLGKMVRKYEELYGDLIVAGSND